MEDANLAETNLRGAKLANASLENADLNDACLERAELFSVNMMYAALDDAYLDKAKLVSANLRNANLTGTHLTDANLLFTHLEGAFLSDTHLESADFGTAVVDGSTVIWGCKVNRQTDFRGVGLDSAQIDAGTKQLLKYNIRRMNWEDWYKEHSRLKRLVKPFWLMSDYGLSTWQIIKTFFQWVLIFAAVYFTWGFIDYHLLDLKNNPGIVSNLFVLESQQEAVSPWLVPFRSVYFSIVTMTTLGFGDIYANAHSFLRGLFGHTLLALQVILGYVLLGALITRFAVLFTAGGPAGKFADDINDKATEDLERK